MSLKSGIIIGFTIISALVIYLILSNSNIYYIQVSENEDWVIDHGIIKSSILKTEYSYDGIYYMGSEEIAYDSMNIEIYIEAKDGSGDIIELDRSGLTVSEVKTLIEGEWLGSSGTHGIKGFSEDKYDLENVYVDIEYSINGDASSDSVMFEVSVNEEGENQLMPSFSLISKRFVLSKGGNTSDSLFYIGQPYDEVVDICDRERLFNKYVILFDGNSDGYPPDKGDISLNVGNKDGIGMFFNNEEICYMIYIREELPTNFGVQVGDKIEDVEENFGTEYLILSSSKEGMSIEYDMESYYIIFQFDKKGLFGIQLDGVSYEHFLD